MKVFVLYVGAWKETRKKKHCLGNNFCQICSSIHVRSAPNFDARRASREDRGVKKGILNERLTAGEKPKREEPSSELATFFFARVHVEV